MTEADQRPGGRSIGRRLVRSDARQRQTPAPPEHGACRHRLPAEPLKLITSGAAVSGTLDSANLSGTIGALTGTLQSTGNDVIYTFPSPLGAKKFARLKVTGP